MQQQQQAMQNNPVQMKTQVEMAKLQQQAQEAQADHQLEMEKLQFEREKLAIEKEIAEDQTAVQLIKAQTELAVHKVDKEHTRHDMGHRHLKEALELHLKHQNLSNSITKGVH